MHEPTHTHGHTHTHTQTPLRFAAKAGYAEVAEILLKRNANPGKLTPLEDDVPNALDLAIQEGHRYSTITAYCPI